MEVLDDLIFLYYTLYLCLVVTVNGYNIFLEALLFHVQHFLRIGNFASTISLLGFETITLLIVYSLPYNLISLSLYLIVLRLIAWVTFFNDVQYNLHDLMFRIAVILAVRWILPVPVRFIPLAWCLYIVKYYVNDFTRRSIHDIILLIGIIYILTAVVIFDHLVDMSDYYQFIAIAYVFVVAWLWVKKAFLSLDELEEDNEIPHIGIFV